MARFRMLPKVGPHKQDGKLYFAGQVVSNEADLVKLFPGKFEYLDGPVAQDTGEDPERVEANTMDRRQAARPRRSQVVKPTENAPEVPEDGNDDQNESGESADRVEELPEGAEEDAEEGDEDQDAEEKSPRRTAAKKKKGR